MPQAILPLFLALAFAVGVVAAPPASPKEHGKSPEALSAALAGEWSELYLGILIPQSQELMGVKVRRLNKPFSLRFTIQAIRGDESGAESPIAYEKVNELLRDTVTHYRTAHAANDEAKRASSEVGSDADAKHSRVSMVMKIGGVGIDLSTMADVGTRFAPYCEWLGSLAALAPAPASPGEPPEKVEAMLRGNWNELTVGVHYSDGCTGPHTLSVTFSKREDAIGVKSVHVRHGQRRDGEAIEISKEELPAIAAKVLKFYQAAFNEHGQTEQSIGEAIHDRLASVASVARGEGQPYGDGFIMMFLAAKTGETTQHFENEMLNGSVMDWIVGYESPRKNR